jgi:DNA replication licensing factor MCM5
VKDEHNEERDMTLAKHVMNIHVNAAATEDESAEGELSLSFLKKYINYARSRCGPRLSQVIVDANQNSNPDRFSQRPS